MATDDRYPSSAKTVVRLDGDDGAVHYVKLNPLAHQTSRLEFTIRKEKNDPAVFSLDVMPQGVEVSGVQKYYRIENEKLGWNWCWTKSPQVYLEANGRCRRPFHHSPQRGLCRQLHHEQERYGAVYQVPHSADRCVFRGGRRAVQPVGERHSHPI